MTTECPDCGYKLQADELDAEGRYAYERSQKTSELASLLGLPFESARWLLVALEHTYPTNADNGRSVANLLECAAFDIARQYAEKRQKFHMACTW